MTGGTRSTWCCPDGEQDQGRGAAGSSARWSPRPGCPALTAPRGSAGNPTRGVLPTEAEDEGADLGGLDLWSAGAPSHLVCPLLPNELPVPAEQGLGLTTNEDHRPLGIARLAAASRSRSRRRRRGRFTCCCITFTWCRSTRSSMSFTSCRRLPAPSRRRTRKYTSENSMELLPVEESDATGAAWCRTWVSEPSRPRAKLGEPWPGGIDGVRTRETAAFIGSRDLHLHACKPVHHSCLCRCWESPRSRAVAQQTRRPRTSRPPPDQCRRYQTRPPLLQHRPRRWPTTSAILQPVGMRRV